MRKITTCVQWSLLMLGLIAVSSTGCRTSASWTKTQAEQLRQAGERLGVPVRTEGMVNFSQAGASLLVAAAANLESIPATELPRGVNIGVAYLDSPGQSFPRDFYTLRATADARQVGTIDGRVQLVNREGRVAAELPATVHIQSMTLPASRPIRPTIVSLGCLPKKPGDQCNSTCEVCHCCENGFIVCTRGLIRIPSIPRAILDPVPN